jgi:hypothetical protein
VICNLGQPERPIIQFSLYFITIRGRLKKEFVKFISKTACILDLKKKKKDKRSRLLNMHLEANL